MEGRVKVASKLKPKLTVTAIERAVARILSGKTSEIISHAIGPKPT
jgi:hypothetical protein